MKYIIDGHNLIPKIRGLSLTHMDDENELIELLQEYARRSRRILEVFFDRAPDGFARTIKKGTLKITYVTNRKKADEEIIAYVLNHITSDPDLTVVSSDHHVTGQCKYHGAKVITSDTFADEIRRILSKDDKPSDIEPTLSESDVNEWLEVFAKGKKK